MTGNNKKGRRKRSEQVKATFAKGASSAREDDKVSKLIYLNQILVKEITGLREEKGILSTSLIVMELEIESRRKMTENLKEAEKELRKELTKKDKELQATISQAGKQLQKAEERFNAEISAELEATGKGAKLEKDVLSSQIVEAKKDTAEITTGSQIAQEAQNVEREKSLSGLAELQTNLDFVASQKGPLSQTNRELRTEAESLKAHLVSEIESAKRMTEEWKEAEKELRKELAKKDKDYQAAVSQANKQFQEAEERFNTEISAKEKECEAVNLHNKNLEATVLQLKSQIQAKCSELEATSKGRKLEKDVLLSHIVGARKETDEITTSKNVEKEILLSRLGELQTNLELMASEKESLSERNRKLGTEAESLKVQLVSEIESATKMSKEWKEAELELRRELAKKDEQYEAAISRAGKQLQEAEERFNTEISAKAEESGAVNLVKKHLEHTVLQLENQIRARSSELEATSEGRKLEKDVFLSQIATAKKETAEIIRSSQMAQEAWNAEKEILLSRFADLQTNLELMASEKESLSQTNRKLGTEAESLKARLDEYDDKLVSMEDERHVLKAVSVSNAERLEALLKQNAAMEEEISSLRKRTEENVKQHSDVIQQYQVAENSLKQENQMLHKEVHRIRFLIETKNKIVEERIVEYNKLSNQVEQLCQKIVEWQETHANVVQEKDKQMRELESLHAEAVKRIEAMEEKHSELFKEKEEQAKVINSLLSRNPKESTKKDDEFTEKCLQSQHTTVAQEEQSELVEIVNSMDVQEKPKSSNMTGKQNPSNVNKKLNPKDAIAMERMQENRRGNGRHQKKTQKNLQRKWN